MYFISSNRALCGTTGRSQYWEQAVCHGLSGTELAEGDIIPNLICSECTMQLKRAYDFKLLCETTERKLREEYLIRLENDCKIENNFEEYMVERLEDDDEPMEILEDDGTAQNTIIADINGENESDDSTLVVKGHFNQKIAKVENENNMCESNTVDDSQTISNVNSKMDQIDAKKQSSDESPRIICGFLLNSSEKLPIRKKKIRGRTKSGKVKPQNPKNTQDKQTEFPCHICSEIFQHRTHFERHVRNIHKRKPYFCEKCKTEFTRSYHIVKHMRIHSEGERLRFPCKSCDRKYTTRENLYRHVTNMHSNVKNYVCEFCGKCFARREQIENHYAYHNEAENFNCDECGKKFNVYRQLRLHKKLHDPEYRLKIILKQKKMQDAKSSDFTDCPECGESMPSKDLLLEHMRTHAIDRPYKCAVCRKGFKKECTLLIHRRVHSGERPYKCDCGSAFKQWSHLQYHKRLHSDDPKPYLCVACGKTFASEQILRIHTRIHTGEKPFKCSICGKAFADKAGCKKHVKRHTLNDQTTSKSKVLPKVELDEDDFLPNFICTDCTMRLYNAYAFKNLCEMTESKLRNEYLAEQEISQDNDFEYEEVFIERVDDDGTVVIRTQNKCQADIGDANPKESVSDEDNSNSKPKAVLNNITAVNVTNRIFNDHEDMNKLDNKFTNEINYSSVLAKVQEETNVPLPSIICGFVIDGQKSKKRTTRPLGKPGKHLPEEINPHVPAPANFPCQICGENFVHRSRFERHVVAVHKKKPYSCSICLKEISRINRLERHMQLHAGTIERKTYACNLCDRKYTCRENMLRHVNDVHKKLKNLVCEFCGARFARSEQLKEHKVRHIEESNYGCDKCNRKFKTEQRLLRHKVIVHEPDKVGQRYRGKPVRFQCTICNIWVASKATLRDHNDKHLGYKRYLCPFEGCGKRFYSYQPFYSHKRQHSELRPFICKICGDGFRQWSHLYEHKRLHSDIVKPYECEVCGNKYATKTYFLIHKRIHTGERPFHCQFCDKRFTDKGVLKRHQVRHENGATTTKNNVEVETETELDIENKDETETQ